MSDNILRVKNLKKVFHSKDKEMVALKDITFSIKNQEFVSIVGPSGCGKSTILGILTNVLEKSDGTIEYYKDNITIGYMLQYDALFPWKTIFENCLLGIEIKRKITDEDKHKVLNLLEKYGLEEFKDQYPDSLSGGMKQRVALIRTLAVDPDILLLDEPFSSLDYQTRLTLSDDIYQIIKNEKKTAIMVTHDIGEAVSMSDRIIVLTKRPSTIKNVHEIKLENKQMPTFNRKDQAFMKYYDIIWKELDHHV